MGELDKKINPEWISAAPNPDTFIKEYKQYTKHPVLEEMLKNKRIAFVGPSPHLKMENVGELIDSYDIVIRVGWLKEPTEEYGKRTDVIIHSFNQFEIPVAITHKEFFTNKFVLCSMVSHDFLDEHEAFFDFIRNRGCIVQNVDDNYLYKVFREVGTTCNVGFSGLITLLNYDFKEIYVTGITFYNMGNYGKVYESDYYSMVTDEIKLYPNSNNSTTPDQARADLHNQPSQINHFRKILKEDPRIKLDNYLSNNFS